MTWSITITANDATTYTPAIYGPPNADYPQEIPTADGVPRLKLGVLDDVLGANESWFDDKFENCDIDVSKDGTTLPYSTVIGASEASADGLTVLTAEGGDELDRRVDESFGVIETHNAAQQVVQNNTGYGVDIPTPSTTTTTETVRDRSGGLTSSDLSPQKDTSPAHVDGNGHLTLHQTLHFHEDNSTLATIGDQVTFNFTTNYSIPAGQVGIALNAEADLLVGDVILEASIDGTVIGIYPEWAFFPTGVSAEDQWERKIAPNVRLPPGTHTARFEVVQVTKDGRSLNSLNVNGAAVYDDRFEYTFDPSLVAGPELFPSTTDGTTVSLPPAITTQAVTGVDFTGTYTDAEPVEVTVATNDQEQTGFGDQSADFANRGAAAEVEIGFRAYGNDTNQTPEQGFKCTTLEAFTLDADLETMPMTVNERYQGTVAEVLTELGDTLRGDFVWTYDTDGTGSPIVRFIRTGTRSNAEDNIESYSIDKDVSGVLEEIKVIGGPVKVTGEQIRVQHDTAVPLQQDNLIEGSESVEQDGEVFDRGREYEIDYDAGTITANSSVARRDAIPDDSLVTVSYAFQPSATQTAAGVTTPDRTAVVDELPLRSDAACSLAAEQILDSAQSPRFTANARVRADTTFSAVAELDSDRLPGPNYEVVDIAAALGGTEVRLEAQKPPSEVIAQVENTIRDVARHVR